MSPVPAANPPLFRFNGFVLDVAHRSLRHADREVDLRPRSFEVLAYLVSAAGRAVGKDELLQAVWPDLVVTEDSLTRCISDIRQALGDEGQRVIKTLPRRGYVFVATLVDAQPAQEPAARAMATEGARRWPWMLGVAAVLALLVGLAAWHWGGPDSQAPRLSIVVLPLTSRDADDSQGWLADAVTEEITVDLSRIPDAVVIARGSAESYRGKAVDARRIGRELGVRYVLEGQLEHADAAVRLLLQLVDARSGYVLWAERIEGERHDLASLRQRVTATVANSLQIRLAEVESSRSRQLPAADLEARDLALQAWSRGQLVRTPQVVVEQRELAQRAIARDANSALAWAALARSYNWDVSHRYLPLRGVTREQWLDRAIEAADRAYNLDANDPRVINARAFALALRGRSEEALSLYERAIGLNRNDALAWFGVSYSHATLGHTQDAIAAGHEAIRLNPRDANIGGFYVVMAAAHLYAGNDAQAVEWARRSALEKPDFSVAYSWLASAAALSGDTATAQSALSTFRRLLPQYTVTSFRAEKLCANALCESQRERYYEGLIKAGLPE